jgi:hypothetical protein
VQAASQGRKFGDNDSALLGKTRAMAKKVSVKWLGKPEDHDYPAALSYLSLIYDATTAASLVKKLKRPQ